MSSAPVVGSLELPKNTVGNSSRARQVQRRYDFPFYQETVNGYEEMRWTVVTMMLKRCAEEKDQINPDW